MTRVRHTDGDGAGRARDASGLINALVIADVAPTDTSPRNAARRLERPPRAASSAATPTHNFE